MALQFSGIAGVDGRVITPHPVVSGGTYTIRLPQWPHSKVLFAGVIEVLQSGDPVVGEYSQRSFLQLYVRSQRYAVGTISAGCFFGLYFARPGIQWEIHR